jgi:cell division transport system permease protein
LGVMCYLATLALGGLMLVEQALSQWASGISSEITVHVAQRSGHDVKAETAKALDIVSATDGIISARELGEHHVETLLEPWLGATPALAELPLPQLIAAEIDPRNPPDLAALERRLAAVPGARLDTHRLWQTRLARTASTFRRLSLAILVLIASSAAGLVIFATRSVLDANRGVIDVLSLVGASDGFIARAVKGRFLRTASIAGLSGMLGGIATFAILGLIGSPAGDSGLGAASAGLLISAPSVAAATYAVFLLVPVCATLLSLATAHLAIMRQLRGN